MVRPTAFFGSVAAARLQPCQPSANRKNVPLDIEIPDASRIATVAQGDHCTYGEQGLLMMLGKTEVHLSTGVGVKASVETAHRCRLGGADGP